MSVRLENLSAGYVADVPVVSDIELDVEARSITTIIGPNGSGKSTLLKAVMGLVRTLDGRVLLDGHDVRGRLPHQRVVDHGVAYVPQLANVFGPLTIWENLEVGGARLSRGDRRARARELLETYPALVSRRRQRADSLSGGQRQMLALARALMTRPRLLLLDEPSAGLSPALMHELFEVINAIRDRDGVTVLLVEQNAAQSLAISDDCVVLVGGRVAMSARATDILADPRVSELYLGASPEPTITTS